MSSAYIQPLFGAAGRSVPSGMPCTCSLQKRYKAGICHLHYISGERGRFDENRQALRMPIQYGCYSNNLHDRQNP